MIFSERQCDEWRWGRPNAQIRFQNWLPWQRPLSDRKMNVRSKSLAIRLQILNVLWRSVQQIPKLGLLFRNYLSITSTTKNKETTQAKHRPIARRAGMAGGLHKTGWNGYQRTVDAIFSWTSHRVTVKHYRRRRMNASSDSTTVAWRGGRPNWTELRCIISVSVRELAVSRRLRRVDSPDVVTNCLFTPDLAARQSPDWQARPIRLCGVRRAD